MGSAPRIIESRRDCVERLAKQFMRAWTGNCSSVNDLPVLAMALADKAYGAAIDAAASNVESFSHYADGRESQTKRYIADAIRRL